MLFGRISSRNVFDFPFFIIVEDIRETFVSDISCFATLLLYISNKIASHEIFQFQKIGSSRKRHGLWQ